MRKRTKFLALRVSVVLAFTILAGRVWYVQVVMGSYYRAQADTSKLRNEPVTALRGIIYDRYGRQLVYNAPNWNVDIVPHGVPFARAASLYRRLSQLLHGQPTPRQIEATVQANLWRPYQPIPIKENVNPDRAMIIKQLHTELPGVRAEPTSVRSYRSGPGQPEISLAHILGYTSAINAASYVANRRNYPAEHVQSSDQIGVAGIEGWLDAYLHGVNGNQQVEVDAGERPIRVLHQRPAVAGDSAYLTIDWNLQQEVARDLAAGLDHLHLKKGVAILEDVHSGQILSMVSLPSFDNNLFSGGIKQRAYDSLLNDPTQPLNDLATAGQFPPGSTYKVITAAAALGTGVADANRVIDDTGEIKLYGHTYFGWQPPPGLGPMTVVSALARSSDIYFYTVTGGNPLIGPMPSIGGERLAQYARMFGLGTKTGIENADEQPGLVPSPSWFNQLKPTPGLKNPGDSWHIGDNYNMAIGQGFNLATPLQMVNVAATVANGGTLYRPHLVERIVGRVVPRQGVLPRRTTIEPFVPSVIRRDLIPPDQLALIQEGMHLSVTPLPYGTSWNVVDPRIDAAGKTGTAEDKTPDGVSSPDAWWIGYAPFQNPRVAVMVLVPNANAEGAYVAAPIAHKVLEDYFHLPSLKPNWVQDVQQKLVPGGAQ